MGTGATGAGRASQGPEQAIGKATGRAGDSAGCRNRRDRQRAGSPGGANRQHHRGPPAVDRRAGKHRIAAAASRT